MPGLVSSLIAARSAGYILALPGHDCHPPPPLHCVPVRPILQCPRDIRGELTASTCRTQIVRDVRMEGRPRVPYKVAEVFLSSYHLTFSFLLQNVPR